MVLQMLQLTMQNGVWKRLKSCFCYRRQINSQLDDRHGDSRLHDIIERRHDYITTSQVPVNLSLQLERCV